MVSVEMSTSLTTTPLHNTMKMNTTYEVEYTDFIYPGFYFERSVYLYVWEILVVFTSLVNVIAVSILLRKELRNPTNVVLTAIAISDSLTGLSTLPAYRMTYQQYSNNNTCTIIIHRSDEEINNYTEGHYARFLIQKYQCYLTNNQTESTQYFICPYVDGFILKKEQCEWFMISKTFISPSFHSISVYLTVLLAIHRFIIVAAPYKARFLRTKHIVVICLMITLLSPIPHVYHLFDDKRQVGLCAWFLKKSCQESCVYLLTLLIIVYLIPCIILILFTIMFICKLRKSKDAIRVMNVSHTQMKRRVVENRRMTIIVVAIVIVFLISEIPRAFLSLITLIITNSDSKIFGFETLRAMLLASDVLMVISFHANSYIYVFLNPRFRALLFEKYVQSLRRCICSIRRVPTIVTSKSIEPREHMC